MSRIIILMYRIISNKLSLSHLSKTFNYPLSDVNRLVYGLENNTLGMTYWLLMLVRIKALLIVT